MGIPGVEAGHRGGRRTSTLGPITGGPRKRTLVPVSAQPGVPPEAVMVAELRQAREQSALARRWLLPTGLPRDRAQAVSCAYRHGIAGA